jgi:hypothetical protein
MGYFDTSDHGLFQTMADGHTVYFPFGQLGRGYQVPYGPVGESLHQQYKAWLFTALIMGLGSLIWAGYLAFLVSFVVWAVLYSSWALYMVRYLQPSNEKFSFRRSGRD